MYVRERDMGRSVQCQHCGQFGHNRRSCPQIKEAHARVEKLAEKYGIERSEDERAYASARWLRLVRILVVASVASAVSVYTTLAPAQPRSNIAKIVMRCEAWLTELWLRASRRLAACLVL